MERIAAEEIARREHGSRTSEHPVHPADPSALGNVPRALEACIGAFMQNAPRTRESCRLFFLALAACATDLPSQNEPKTDRARSRTRKKTGNGASGRQGLRRRHGTTGRSCRARRGRPLPAPGYVERRPEGGHRLERRREQSALRPATSPRARPAARRATGRSRGATRRGHLPLRGLQGRVR